MAGRARKNKPNHSIQKKRAQYVRVFNKYIDMNNKRKDLLTDYANTFESLINEIKKLRVKTLQVMLTDLNKHGYIAPYAGYYHQRLKETAEFVIIENTLLK